MIKIDALGLACPMPVVKAKKALTEMAGSGQVEILVDNKESAENLEKLAKSLGCSFELKEVNQSHYQVTITKTEDFLKADDVNRGKIIVVISGDKMGEGSDELGKSLMKAFIYALTEADTPPDKIIFYNGGAKLATKESPVIEDIIALENKGVEVLTCGACLNYYGLTEKLAAGSVTNMYAILENMIKAGRIIKP